MYITLIYSHDLAKESTNRTALYYERTPKVERNPKPGHHHHHRRRRIYNPSYTTSVAYSSHASISFALVPGSVAEWPASLIKCRRDSGHA